MATEAVKFNKSARIRELVDSGLGAKEIKQSLDADGHETTINTVYTAIANYKKSKAGMKRKSGAAIVQKSTSSHGRIAGTVAGNGIIGHLESIKALVKELGAAQAHKLVDLFA